jgi:iron-sulfur cluster assembly protein
LLNPIINVEDMRVAVDKSVDILFDRNGLLYLPSTDLDFFKRQNGEGFQFINPNASRNCSCGERFSSQ